jgi:hypothetical protein
MTNSLPFGILLAAVPMSATKNPEAEYAYGAGNINPLKAQNPGLVYEIDTLDYIKFLCGQGYSTKLLQLFTGDSSSCSKHTNGTVFDLNYPSFALVTSSSKSISQAYNWTVTNVGSPTSTYKAILTSPLGLKIKVNPSVLSFTTLGQKLSFALTIEGITDKSIDSASLVWDDGTFQVRSPMAPIAMCYGSAMLTSSHGQGVVGKVERSESMSQLMTQRMDYSQTF